MKHTLPKSIRNMISRAYDRGETSRQAADRINSTRTAERLGITVSQASVAASYAWITTRQGN